MDRGGRLENKQRRKQALDFDAKQSQDRVTLDKHVPGVGNRPLAQVLPRPVRPLSKGIRIYWHEPNGRRLLTSYNYELGIQIVKMLTSSGLKNIAIGTEEGAMCLHYKKEK